MPAIWVEVLQLRSKRQVFARRNKSGLADAQQCPTNPGLPQQIVSGYSQNLAFASHVYRLDPLKQAPSGGCASWSLDRSQAALDGSVVRCDSVVRIGACDAAATDASSPHAAVRGSLLDNRVDHPERRRTADGCLDSPMPSSRNVWRLPNRASGKDRIHGLPAAVYCTEQV